MFREGERMSTLTVDQLKESSPKFNLAPEGLTNIYPLMRLFVPKMLNLKNHETFRCSRE